MAKYSTQKKQKAYKKKRLIIILAVVFVAFIGTLAILQLTNTTHFFAKQASSTVIPSSDPSSKATTPSDEKQNTEVPSSGASSPPEDPKQGDATNQTTPTGSPPITPYGNFVSNHSPNLSGSPAPTSEQSVCNTTPGASCYIEFTDQQGTIKKLAAQTTDTNGTTYWNWDVKQAGFTTGAWNVKVVATLNGQTSTAEDAQALQVNP